MTIKAKKCTRQGQTGKEDFIQGYCNGRERSELHFIETKGRRVFMAAPEHMEEHCRACQRDMSCAWAVTLEFANAFFCYAS